MQNFSLFQSSDYVSDAPAQLNDNFKSVASDFKGSSFPSANLFEGMKCFRSDENKMYRLGADLKTWNLMYSIVSDGISVSSATNATNAINAQTAVNATNAVNAVKSQTAVTSGSAEKAIQDGNGNNIIETYVSKNNVGNEANKIPVYNSEGHLVFPNGSELWIE